MTAQPEPGPTDLLAVLRDLADLVAGPTSVEGILQAVGDRCTDVLPVHGVGVLLRDDAGGLLVATANTELGRIVEDLEAELDEGPCSEALRTGTLVAVPDLAAEATTYPRFAPKALDAGVRAIYGLPMTARGQHIGALDVIAREPSALTADQLAVAQLLADVTTAYIVNSRLLDESSALAGHLQHALDSRMVIEQAKGVLAERHGIDLDPAFERMRVHARRNRVRLHDVARAVLAGELHL